MSTANAAGEWANRHKWDVRFLSMAQLVASWSKDPTTKVGAVIVRPDRTVASVGFNGFPRRMRDDAERYADRAEKLSRVIHAEINALVHAGGLIAGCTLYTWPFLPCDRCAVQMIQAGIVRMVAPEPKADHGERWGSEMGRTRSYAQEAGVAVTEVPLLEIG